MKPRQAFFDCLHRSPPALFEAALWIAAEHDRELDVPTLLKDFKDLQRLVSHGLPMLPVSELGQPLLRRLNDLGFAQDDSTPLRPRAALLDKSWRTNGVSPWPSA
jgi:regulator of sirC expression with transglutaminase-like and TPR domain